jgi:hypothetical protein
MADNRSTAVSHFEEESRMKLVPVALAAALLSSYAASAASAAPVKQAGFCGTAKGVAAYIVSSGNSLNPTGGESLATVEKKLKVAYAAIIKSEGALKSSAPSSIKPDLLKAFSVINYIDAKMSSVGWDFTKVVPFAQSLSAKAQSAGPAIKHLDAYFKGTCHIKGA